MKKVIGIIIWFVLFVALSLGVFLNAPYVFRFMTGKKFYNETQYKQNYDAGYKAGVDNYPELTANLKYYKSEYSALLQKHTELNAKYNLLVESNNALQTELASMEAQIENLNEKISNYEKQLAYYTAIYEEFNVANYTKVIFANEDETTFACSFVENGGSPTIFVEPEKAGYNFMGWSLDKTNVVDLSAIEITEDTTFYAVFKKVHVVTFSYGGNADEVVFNVVDGECLTTLPETPTMEGYEFVGWSAYDISIITNEELSTYPIAKDLTFYASFRELITNVNMSNLQFKTLSEEFKNNDTNDRVLDGHKTTLPWSITNASCNYYSIVDLGQQFTTLKSFTLTSSKNTVKYEYSNLDCSGELTALKSGYTMLSQSPRVVYQVMCGENKLYIVILSATNDFDMGLTCSYEI